MELTTQYTSTSSTQTTPAQTSADRSLAANAPATQARIFPEYGFSDRSAMTPQERTLNLTRNTTGRSLLEADTHLANTDPVLSREKRGGVLGACAKPESEFRERRGGDALSGNASGHVGFDQFDRRETRGSDGRGTCDGIVRTMMFGADAQFGTSRGDLPSLVKDMKSDMNSRGAAKSGGIFDRIENSQRDRGRALLLPHYSRIANTPLTPPGTSTQPGGGSSQNRHAEHAERITALNDHMANLPEGGLAYIRMRIQDSAGKDRGGHVILAQRLPSNPSADGHASPERYAIFDPNNGVFTYESLHDMQTALREYMNSAYNEDGYLASPEQLTMYRPLSSAEYHSPAPVLGPQMAQMTMPPPGPTTPREPEELPKRPHLACDRSDL